MVQIPAHATIGCVRDKGIVSKQQDNLKTTVVEHMRFKDTLKQKYKHEENPQVRKTGADAVHGSCPPRSNM